MFYPFFPYHSTCFFAFLEQSQDSTLPGRVPQVHFSLFLPRNGRKMSKGVRLVWTGFCMEPASGSWLPWKHMHFSICRKRSSFDWLCTPVLCPTTGFGVTIDCSKHPEKPSLSVVGCSGGDGFCDLAGGLSAYIPGRRHLPKTEVSASFFCLRCPILGLTPALGICPRSETNRRPSHERVLKIRLLLSKSLLSFSYRLCRRHAPIRHARTPTIVN